MPYETGLLVLVFVILALIIGAGIRHALKGTQIPYTVALLIIGLGIGLVHRTPLIYDYSATLGQTLDLVAEISPHLILFVFLPTLIFESAFAMEVHLFRRMFLQIAILAVPGLMLSTSLTAGLAKWAFPWEWGWALCFMFGALISATDPVAVVALLKEVSSRKRLETLIEGESLLNDGTAIVFFSLFYGWVLLGFSDGNTEISADAWSVAGQFLYVVSLGLLIGIIIGGICIMWMNRVFNDPLIEITLTIAAAYSVFFIAESFHVSGVVAVVALALILASVGRTRISPEVAGFLHHFWEMMAHIANTLIFLLVGILVAIRVPLDDIQAWQALFILYAGILIIRGFSITVFMPLLKRIGIGINYQKATVLWWGGLRGAVSLALALTVAANDLIPKEIGDHILFLCAGIVVLTILVNGSTMGKMLKLLGLDSLPPAKQATVDKATNRINHALNKMLPDMMNSEFLKGANWQEVKEKSNLKAADDIQKNVEITEEDLNTAFQRRLLETERKHYWSQFEQGTLSKQATNRLVEAVEQALDGEPCIGPRPKLFNQWKIPPWLNRFRKYPHCNRLLIKAYFSRLALGYDVARGFIQAQDGLDSHIDSLAPNADAAERIHALVSENKKMTFSRIESLRESFPEIIQALQSQAAIRLLLNRERAVINEQLKLAVLDKPEAARMLDNVEERMMALQNLSVVQKSQEQKLIQDIPWALSLNPDTREKLSSLIEHGVYQQGQTITEQDKPLNSIGIVSRGSVTEHTNQSFENGKKIISTTRGPGESFAALSLLTHKSPALYVADTPTDIMWLPGDKVRHLMGQDIQLAFVVSQLFEKGDTN